VEPENVVLTAIKKAEDDGALVLRFYEWAGKATDVVLAVPAGAKSASETNLMETRIGDLSLADGKVTVSTKPYEIKTVKVDYGLTRELTQQELP
jgi:alpha-mannosidase